VRVVFTIADLLELYIYIYILHYKLTTPNMWKKFLGVMALIGLLSSQTASAVLIDEVNAPGVTPPLESLTVTPGTFNPGEGETVEITVEVNEPSLVTLKVLDPATNDAVATLYSSEVVETSRVDTYAGILGNGSVLADGDYTVNAFAVSTSSRNMSEADVVLTVTSDPSQNGDVEIEKFDVSTTAYNPLEGNLRFEYDLSVVADAVQFEIVDLATDDVVASAVETDTDGGSFEWDGTDEDGANVPASDYLATLTAVVGHDMVSATLDFDVVYDTPSGGSVIITNVEVDPYPTWDPSEEDLELEWELEEEVDDFVLYAEEVSGSKDVELWEDEDMDDDDYEFEWNGLDEDDDYIDEGLWAIVWEADDDTYSVVVDVEYSAPEVSDDLFVTKTTFDNTIDEFSYVVFLLEDDALVTVEVMDGNKEVVTLMDEEELSKKKWYAVKWDGMDDDGDEEDEGEYEFKVTAANLANDDAYSTKTVDVEVEEDDPSNKTNATNDFINPIVIPKTTTEGAVIEYTLDDEAEVTVEIFKGGKSSNPEVVLEDDVVKSEGTYTVSWDGRDEDGKKLDKDEKYSYRVTAKTVGSTSKTDKERGFFVIGYEGGVGVEPTPPGSTGKSCGFYDVPTTSPYCEAIAWAKAEGIFVGDPNGAFRPYDFLKRAESLKVTLLAFGVPVLADDMTDLGFTDTIVGEWYMKYLRTGKFYGMVNGYEGTTLVKPEYEINRVELLKYVLEAAETVNGYNVPVCNVSYYNDTAEKTWYTDYVCMAHDYDLYNTYAGYFYPGNKVTRAEVAQLLYRLSNSGLLQ